MKSFSRILRDMAAKLNGQYDYSSLQIQLPEDLAEKVLAWGKKNIADEDLHNNQKDTKGREDDIHVTVCFGITTSCPDGVKNLLAKIAQPFKARLGLVTLFRDKADYDVVKIEVESPDLQKLHYAVRDALTVESDYPTYQSHTTVAYVKKGAADELNGDESFREKTFDVDEIVFSSYTGDKIPIKLNKGE